VRKPLHSWAPPHAESYGDLAASLAEQVGMPMDDEQKIILDAIYAEDEPGVPTCFEVGVVAPRQNLKTAVLEIAAMTDVFILGEPLHMWTAHVFDTAQRAFNDMVGMIGRTPDLRDRCIWPPSASHGDEAIELVTGERIEFHARSTGKGRGLSGDRITFDEALYLTPSMIGSTMPILATRPGAQIRYGSSAGLLRSGHLRGLRNRGRKGGESRLAWFEWGAKHVKCAQANCSHTIDMRGCALDREELWHEANPALGRRITLQIMRDFRRSMPPEEFAREFLSWWEDPEEAAAADLAIDPEVWKARRTPGSRTLHPVSLGVDVNRNRTATISAVGWREDGRKHGEVIYSRPGTSWVVPELLRIIEHVDPAAVVLDSNRAGSIITELQVARIEPTIAFLRHRAAGDRGLVDDLVDDRMVVVPCKPIDDAAATTTWRDVGEAQVFDGKGSGDISPMVSLSLARHGLLLHAAEPVAPPPPPARPIEPVEDDRAAGWRPDGLLDLSTTF